MRVGVFGGTFDPVHFGHLILAEQCREQGRLDEVLFVPAPRPPHKPQPSARFDQRVEMLALALAGNPVFRIDEIEKDREGPSYTTDTLAELRRRRPGDEFWLLVGSDTVRDLHLWYEPRRLVEMAGLLVMDRPGSPAPDGRELGGRLGLPADRPPRLVVVEARGSTSPAATCAAAPPRDAASATSCRAPSSATSTTDGCTKPHRPSRKRERRCLHPSLTLPARTAAAAFHRLPADVPR